MTDRQFFVRSLFVVTIILVVWYRDVLDHYLIREIMECGRTCVSIKNDRIEVGYIGWRGGWAFNALIWEQNASDAPDVVRVDSIGGDFGVAMRMVEALQARDIRRPVRIEVLADGRCESMCTVL